MNVVFLQSPSGDEIKQVEATAAKLGPLMATGWHQVPPPAAEHVASTQQQLEEEHR